MFAVVFAITTANMRRFHSTTDRYGNGPTDLQKPKEQTIDHSSLFLFQLHVQLDTTHSVTQSNVISDHRDGARMSEGIGWLSVRNTDSGRERGNGT